MVEIAPQSIYFELLHQAGLGEALVKESSGTEVTWNVNSEIPADERERYERILADLLQILDNKGLGVSVSHIELYARSEVTPTTCLIALSPSLDWSQTREAFIKSTISYDEIRRLHGPLGWQFATRFHDANPASEYYEALFGPNPRMEAVARLGMIVY